MGEHIADVKENSIIFKAEGKLGFEVPDLGEELPPGHHECHVELSING